MWIRFRSSRCCGKDTSAVIDGRWAATATRRPPLCEVPLGQACRQRFLRALAGRSGGSPQGTSIARRGHPCGSRAISQPFGRGHRPVHRFGRDGCRPRPVPATKRGRCFQKLPPMPRVNRPSRAVFCQHQICIRVATWSRRYLAWLPISSGIFPAQLSDGRMDAVMAVDDAGFAPCVTGSGHALRRRCGSALAKPPRMNAGGLGLVPIA